MNYKVYLAGGISNLSYGESIGWREYAKERLAKQNVTGRCAMDTDGDGDCPACAAYKEGRTPLLPICGYIRTVDTGIVGYSPMRAKDYLSSVGVISGRPEAYEDYILSSAKGIMYRDSWDVATADVILVNLLDAEKVSIGTVMEIGMAYALRKPVVAALEENNIHRHPMLDTACGWIAPDLDLAIDIVKAILLPDGVKVAEPTFA